MSTFLRALAHRRPLRLALGLLLLWGIVGAASAPRTVRAEVSFGVAPSRVELEAEPGATGSQTLTVANGGDAPIAVTAAVAPYKDATGERSAIDWLAVEPASFRLEPGQEQAVAVAIAVPDDLTAGGRYAAVTFTTGAGAASAGSGAAMAGQIGVPFLVAVDGRGPLTRRAELARFGPVLAWDGRIGFSALLRNAGNLHLFPQGAVEIEAGGEPLGRVEMPPVTALLPESDVLLAAEGTLPLAATTTYRAEATIDYGGKEPATGVVEFAPEAALAVASAAVCENLDRGPTATIGLRNDGQLGVQPLVQVTVLGADGSVVGAPPPQTPLVWPGETSEVAVDVPDRLVSGEYVLAVRVDYAPPAADGSTFLPPVEQQSAFGIGGLGGSAAPLCV